MPKETEIIQPVERAAEEPASQRAIKLVPYLNRTIPYWGHPGYLAGQQWRALVRNQPIAIICRDTLTQNLLSMDWSIRPRESKEAMLQLEKDEIDHYMDVFNEAEGDFDNYIEMIVQDMLDLPFGGMAELGRLNDDPEGPVMWIEHVDGATLIPTGDREWPVIQVVPNAPGRPIVFPSHSIARMYMTPSPQIKRKGWGMAPPEKIYLAIEMLYRGDRYYANLLLDTPEAGLLDLIDMKEDDAEEWLDSWRDLMMGIDGFKVPVLYDHKTPAQWIPFNRPPIDMLYDQTTLKYAAICAAGYGIRLSDIGMAEQSGEKTLAGVIRGERQSRRTGRAMVRSKTENHFNHILPDHLQFIWEEKDEEAKTEQGRALSTYGLALGQLKRDGLLSPEEARLELVSTGLMETEIDPNEIPEPEVPMGMPGKPTFQLPGKKKDKRKPFGKPDDDDRGRVKDEDKGKVSATQGGRGGLSVKTLVKTPPDVPGDPPYNDLIRRMEVIVAPAIASIPELAAQSGSRQFRRSGPGSPIPSAPRIRRLIKAATREMLPSVKRTFDNLDNDAIQRIWLPEMQALDFGMPSELDSMIIRQTTEEIRDVLNSHLLDDQWWKVANVWDKDAILSIFKSAYEVGLEEEAIAIIRSLYSEALLSSPELSLGINFNLTNSRTIRFLERSAAELVTRVNDGTKYFIKRIVVAGVRQGMARPRIAQAIRDGAKAERVLTEEGFMDEAIQDILSGMGEMSEARSESIVFTEVNRATNLGHLRQIIETGLKTKKWTHLGPRGVTRKGNEHPCPVCAGNEKLGFVSVDFLYLTVFSKGGPEDDGRARTPPAHPNVCHCKVIFDEDELKATVARGEYAPYLGGKKKKRRSGGVFRIVSRRIT
jgi:hypothetical protein